MTASKKNGDKSPKTITRTDAPTIADLADLAGVSAITISRALRDSPRVRLEMRRHIQQLARTHGYVLHPAAGARRQRRSMTVAVVLEMKPDAERPIGDTCPLSLLNSIIQALTTAGYSALLTTLRGGPAPGVHDADGVILLGQGAHEDAMHKVQRWGRPLVVWGSVKREERHIVVGSDNAAGGALAAQRFLALGRRRPVFLGDPAHTESAQRLDGFSAALALHGIVPAAQRVADFTIAAGADATDTLLRAQPDFDAVFAANDLLAIGAIRALTEHGRAIPADVSVIGFDDSASCLRHAPPLSTIHQDFARIGTLLVDKIRALIDGRQAASQTLPTRLVLRAT